MVHQSEPALESGHEFSSLPPSRGQPYLVSVLSGLAGGLRPLPEHPCFGQMRHPCQTPPHGHLSLCAVSLGVPSPRSELAPLGNSAGLGAGDQAPECLGHHYGGQILRQALVHSPRFVLGVLLGLVQRLQVFRLHAPHRLAAGAGELSDAFLRRRLGTRQAVPHRPGLVACLLFRLAQGLGVLGLGAPHLLCVRAGELSDAGLGVGHLALQALPHLSGGGGGGLGFLLGVPRPRARRFQRPRVVVLLFSGHRAEPCQPRHVRLLRLLLLRFEQHQPRLHHPLRHARRVVCQSQLVGGLHLHGQLRLHLRERGAHCVLARGRGRRRLLVVPHARLQVILAPGQLMPRRAQLSPNGLVLPLRLVERLLRLRMPHGFPRLVLPCHLGLLLRKATL